MIKKTFILNNIYIYVFNRHSVDPQSLGINFWKWSIFSVVNYFPIVLF